MHLVVVIPAYNESKVIGSVVRSIPKSIKGVKRITALVVDDNSSDQTHRVAQKAGAICVRHESNLGAGGATITGFEAAKKMQADIVVTMDGDGQHRGSDIHHLVLPIIEKRAHVVLGSRLMSRSVRDMPWLKRFGNNALNIVTFVFYRTWVSDSQSGFKAFSRYALRRIRLSTSGYEFCSEIVGQIKQKNIRYVEVPIKTIYTDYSRAKGQLVLNAINIVIGLSLNVIKRKL